MALSQDDRIAISKKMVQIPLQNAAADKSSSQIEVERAKAQKEDDANKQLQLDVTTLINGYQLEYGRLDGIGRNELLEQDMLDSADRKLQNFFFPNDPQTPTPALTDGVWKQMIPYAGNKALGKTYAEVYGTVQKEQDVIDALNAAIAVMEAFTAITRSTGQSCGATGSCSNPMYTDQATCTLNGGVWTPGPDLIANDPAMQAAGTALIAAVQAWEDFMNATYAVIVNFDTDTGRATQNNNARADITNAISIIDGWQALPTYDTTHGQTTCIGFNSYNVNLLDPTKFRAAEFQVIKNEITARQAYITTRLAQLATNMGTIVQDLSTGELTTLTGFYGNRMRIINTRLNAIGGSLSRLRGLERGKAAQQSMKDSNNNTAAVYDAVLFCSAFRAPSTGTATIHVLNGSGFANGNTVYVAAENQAEIQTTIINVTGNTLTLADTIPPKYRQNELARVYKVL